MEHQESRSAMAVVYILSILDWLFLWNMKLLTTKIWLIALVIAVGVTALVWKYFNSKGILRVTIFSTTLQKNLTPDERIFMAMFGYLLMPIFNFGQFQLSNLIISIVIFLFVSVRIYRIRRQA